ncbi:hypothetical protein F2Q68_00020717 [Brassica cretica]|uniref:POT1A/B-like OB fold domain-containing protein n=1 Tax=Brassica cretica TaxID=69181 RepID=A0A8S9FPQ1_BRACR|nr:hypothetical protein F2Q68_00020717 [Brassica cretica]
MFSHNITESRQTTLIPIVGIVKPHVQLSLSDYSVKLCDHMKLCDHHQYYHKNQHFFGRSGRGFSSDENRHYRVLPTLEDPSAILEAFLCDKDAEYFWGFGFQNTEMFRKKWNQLLGIRRGSSNLWLQEIHHGSSAVSSSIITIKLTLGKQDYTEQ